tara:strand:- start:1201 stop:1758 length:558 start_codon:yes stop_codon:yes gene_type:complete
MALLSRNTNILLLSIVTIVTILIAIFVLSIDALYDHDSHLFEFGPSDGLIFLGIKIDTWWKYIFLLLFMWLLEFLDILQEEYLEPFIHMVYDANMKENRKDLSVYSWYDMYFMNHFSMASNGLRQILRVVIVTIQIPLAIVVWLVKETTRVYFVVDVTNNWFRSNNRGGELKKGGRGGRTQRFRV